MRKKTSLILLIEVFCLALLLFLPSNLKVEAVSPNASFCLASMDDNGGGSSGNGDSGNGITIQNPLEAAEFEVILDNIINFIFNVAVVLAPLMIIIAGFLFVTAGGNSEQINRARAIIIWTAVGFLIILLSRGIMGIIKTLLGVR